MVGTKLIELKQEILKYAGIPYFMNVGRHKNSGDNVMVGKGNAKEIALKTIELANDLDIKLLDMTAEDIYKFQKKNHIGIDCSGLATHLLNFYFGTNLNPRRTSADMLTSSPLSKKIELDKIDTADLIRQEDGHHVIFVIEKVGDDVFYVESNRSRRGVRYGQFDINDKSFKHDGIFRLNLKKAVFDPGPKN